MNTKAIAATLASIPLFGSVGCGTPVNGKSPPPPVSEERAAPSAPNAPSASAATPSAKVHPLDDAALFARVKEGLAACYEKGRASVPTMLDGQLTLDAAIDAGGTPSCVIVSDDKGLTQEVEDCMAGYLSAQRFETSAPQRTSLRVAVRGGQLSLATGPREMAAIETVETHRMPDAFDVLESLVPKLHACLSASGTRSALVGARVEASGRSRCALALGSPEPLSTEAATCAENVFKNATFPPPSGGEGLILVPMRVTRR